MQSELVVGSRFPRAYRQKWVVSQHFQQLELEILASWQFSAFFAARANRDSPASCLPPPLSATRTAGSPYLLSAIRISGSPPSTSAICTASVLDRELRRKLFDVHAIWHSQN